MKYKTRKERITFIADADVCTRFKALLKSHDIKPIGDAFEFFMLQVLRDPSVNYEQKQVTELTEKLKPKKASDETQVKPK